MPGPLIILKAFKIKKAAERLLKAKENALRIHHGQRPHYPWYEECWTWCVQAWKNFFCMSFCPCCVTSDNYSENFLRRTCMAGTFPNFILKTFFGFVFGVLLTMGAFMFLITQLSMDPRITTAICSILGVFLTLGLSFSDKARCIALLVIPELFSNRGRVALLAYTYILVMNGPTKNAVRNANVLIESMNCGQELISNQTKTILRSVFAPLIAIIDTMRQIIQALKDFARQMKEAFMAIKELFTQIVDAIKGMFSWILSIVSICSNKYGSPYKRCVNAFDDAIADCEYRLGVFKFLCYIVTAVKYICEIARIVDLLCAIPKAINSAIIKPLKDEIKKFARYMYNQFYVNITLTHYYNYSFDQSKTFAEVRGDIAEEVRERTAWLLHVIDWSDFVMMFFIVFVFVKAFFYRMKYLKADHFDNMYITYHVRDIDDTRGAHEKETILPLSTREKKKYIHTFSIFMGKVEKKKLIVASTILLVAGIQMGFYILLDYSLFHLLEMIRFHGRVQAKAGVPSHVAMNIQGEGVLADMYRTMLNVFDPVLKTAPEFDTTMCLPTPVPIDMDKYQNIAIMYLTCLILTLCESYGLRLRHVICGIYYPAREHVRAVWLYNHILKTRGGLVKFLRRKIRRKFQGDDTIEQVSLLDRLSYQCPLFGRILKSLGYVKIFCVCCGSAGKPDDYEEFKRCSTSGCKGIYCIACFDDINNLCTLCMKPVDYGDISDMSEERDSSEDEELIEALLKAAIEEGDDEYEDDMDYQYEDRESSESEVEHVPFQDVESQNKKDLATISDLKRRPSQIQL